MPNDYFPTFGGASAGVGAGAAGAGAAGAATGGGGWLNSLLGVGSMMNPATAGIMMGGQLLSGLIGGIAAGKKRKEAKQAFQGQQKQYQSAVSRLFPEMSKESFQYKNPAMNDAINAALSAKMMKVFGGNKALNDIFAKMMPSYAYGGIATRPQIAMLGERGPEAIVPLGKYPQGKAPNQVMPYPGMGGGNMPLPPGVGNMGGGYDFSQMRPMPNAMQGGQMSPQMQQMMQIQQAMQMRGGGLPNIQSAMMTRQPAQQKANQRMMQQRQGMQRGGGNRGWASGLLG